MKASISPEYIWGLLFSANLMLLSFKGEGSSKDGYVGSLSLETSGTKQAVGQGQVMYWS